MALIYRYVSDRAIGRNLAQTCPAADGNHERCPTLLPLDDSRGITGDIIRCSRKLHHNGPHCCHHSWGHRADNYVVYWPEGVAIEGLSPDWEWP